VSAAEALFFAHPYWVWIAVGGIFLLGELISGSGWLLWPAGAAMLTALITAVAVPSWSAQIVIFVVSAIVATYLGRRFLRPASKGDRDINDPAPRLIGQQGHAAGAFQNGHGRVFVDGKEWAAELEGGGELAAGAPITVTEIVGGARLRVRAS
jgi:membrane protein implicated in regulation of membrane protease activity